MIGESSFHDASCICSCPIINDGRSKQCLTSARFFNPFIIFSELNWESSMLRAACTSKQQTVDSRIKTLSCSVHSNSSKLRANDRLTARMGVGIAMRDDHMVWVPGSRFPKLAMKDAGTQRWLCEKCITPWGMKTTCANRRFRVDKSISPPAH